MQFDRERERTRERERERERSKSMLDEEAKPGNWASKSSFSHLDLDDSDMAVVAAKHLGDASDRPLPSRSVLRDHQNDITHLNISALALPKWTVVQRRNHLSHPSSPAVLN